MERILEGYRNGSIEYRSTGKDTGGISEWIYRIQIHWEGYTRDIGMDL